MATKNFRSTLLEPTSEFAKGDRLMFTSLSTSGSVFNGSFSEIVIGDSGQYSVDLQYGKYRIDYKPYGGTWQKLANVEVNTDTLATSLQALALSSMPVTDDTILTLQSLLADAETANTESKTARDESVSAAADAEASASKAEDLLSGRLRMYSSIDYAQYVLLLHPTSLDQEAYFFGSVDVWRQNGLAPQGSFDVSSQRKFETQDSSSVVISKTAASDAFIACTCTYNSVKYFAIAINRESAPHDHFLMRGEWSHEPKLIHYNTVQPPTIVNSEVYNSIIKAVDIINIQPASLMNDLDDDLFESEKNIAMQIISDCQLGLHSITEQDITDTRLYIQSIEPLSAASGQRAAIPRPQIFSRYKENPYEL